MKKVSHLFLLVIFAIYFNGCSSGGGVVGDYLDSSSSSSVSDSNTTVDSNTTYFRIENRYIDNNITKTYVEKITSSSVSLNISLDRDNILNIAKIEEMTYKLFDSGVSKITNSDINATLNLLLNAEMVHSNSINNMIDDYGLNYTYSDLPAYFNDSLSTIATATTDNSILNELAYMEEKSIKDLSDTILDTTNADLLELYSKLLIASKNHLRLLVKLIYQNGSFYSPQLLDSVTYNTIVSIISNISSNNLYDENNITSTLVGTLNKFVLSNNLEKESLLYISKEQEMEYTLFLIMKGKSSMVGLVNQMTTISNAEMTHYTATEEAISYYSLESDYEKYESSGLDSLQNLILINTSQNSSREDILKSLLLTEEKSIIDLEKHIAVDVVGNNDLLNLYNNLLIASKNHLKYLALLYYGEITTQYQPQLLDSATYLTIVGSLDSVEVPISSSSPTIDIYSYLGDFNTTKISITELNTDGKPYYIPAAEEISLPYIAQEEYLSETIFTHFNTIVQNPLYSPYLDELLEIKNQINKLTVAESTHFDTIDSMLNIYGVAIAANTGLTDFATDIKSSPTSISDKSDLVEMLSALALLEERSICDLNKNLVKTSDTEIKSLYDKLEKASINHLKLVVNTLEDIQGVYVPQLLTEDNCGTGVSYDTKIGTDANSSVDDNINIYFSVSSGGVSNVQIAQDETGGTFSDLSIEESNSLKYVDYLMNASQLSTATVGVALSIDLVDDIINAKSTHNDTTTEALDIYSITTPYVTNDSIDAFTTLIGTRDISTPVNRLLSLALIEERNILDLEDHIINEVNKNTDLVNIYQALRDSAKNHLEIIDKILTVDYAQTPYICQLLSVDYCATILPYDDVYITGTEPIVP